MDSWKKFNEEQLPAINNFYSNLSLKNISKDEYRHAQEVWSTFNIKNLSEYHD